MTERRNPKLFQVLVCQMGQDSEGNVVLGKAFRVLGHAELLEPVLNLLHRGPTATDKPSSLPVLAWAL